MLLSEALEAFDLSLKGIVAPSTQRCYTSVVRKLLRFLGDRDIETITITDLRRWRASLFDRESRYADHPTRPEEEGGLSVWSVHNYVRGILKFFSWLMEEGLLEGNPAARLKLPELPEEPPKDISRANMVCLVETAQDSSARDYALVCFLADTGCRVGGAAGLWLPDLELDRGRALVREKGKGGKRKARYVYLKQRTVDALNSWLSVRPSDKGDAVFLGLKGPLTESGMYQVLRRLANAADIEGRHNPHAMRHGWARGALRKGADVNDVSQILGHSGIAVTVLFYGQWADDELKERHDQFSWLPEG